MTWRTGGIIAITAALWWGGFGVGRLSKATPPAEVKAVEVVKYQDRVEYRDRTVTVAEKAQVIRRVVRVVVTPDGTKTREVVTDSATNERQAAAASSSGARATAAERVTEVVTIAAPRASWALSVLGGLNAAAALGAERRFWVGAALTHRFIGPLRLGVVAIERPGNGGLDVGAMVGVEF